MSAFWTFAICLTTAYAIYYTVTILLDLNGKTKEKSNDSMGTFELKNVQETPGKVVEETEGGFRVAKGEGENGQPSWEETRIRSAVVDDPVQPDTPPVPMFDASGAPITEGQKKIKAVEKEMEEQTSARGSQELTILDNDI